MKTKKLTVYALVKIHLEYPDHEEFEDEDVVMQEFAHNTDYSFSTDPDYLVQVIDTEFMELLDRYPLTYSSGAI